MVRIAARFIFQSYAPGLSKNIKSKLRNYRIGLGSFRFGVQAGGRERHTEAEGCSHAFRRLEFHRPVMPLKDLISLRQADAVTLFLGGEVKLKNFILHILRDASPLIADLSDYSIFLAMRRNRKLAAFRHGLNSVDHHVEERLLHQIEVRLNDQRLRKYDSLDVDAMLFRFRRGEQSDIVQQAAEVDLHQMQFASPHEVHQSLHHPVEAMNFASDNIHVAASVGIELCQLVLQELEMKNDGVDGVLHFVGDAAGDASAGGEAAGHFDFISNAAH